LSDFFHDYKKVEDEEGRRNLLDVASAYVVANCWRKMFRRMGGWAPAGFIYQLAKVDLESSYKLSQKQGLQGPSEVGSDRPLYQTLKLLKDDVLKGILNQFTPISEKKQPVDNLKKLMAALEDMDQSSDWDKPIYTLEVCVEFHHLLISLLLGYREAAFPA